MIRMTTIGSVPPPWENTSRILGQRDRVALNTRLVIARVVSVGNSISDAETSSMLGIQVAAVGWK